MSRLRPFVLPAALAALLCAAPLAPPAAAQPRPPRAAPPTPLGSIFDDAIVRYQATQGLDAVYDLRFADAEGFFRQVEAGHPAHPAGPFLRALSTWWQILLDLTDTSNDAAFTRQMDEVVRRSDALLRRNPDDFDARFFRGAALGFRGRLRSNRGAWMPAAQDGRAAMDDVLAVSRRDPDNPDFGFGRGLYDYYAVVIPENYAVARPVMGLFPQGNRVRGLRLLSRAAADGTFMKSEAAYFLAQVNYLYEGDYDEAMRYTRQLRRAHPTNPFFTALEGRIEGRWGRWDEMRTAFQSVLQGYRARRVGHTPGMAEQALYYVARADMAQGRYADALRSLTQLESLAARTREDTYFEVLGRLRQAMAYDALGQREQAVARYRQVLTMRNLGDAHDRAREFLETPYPG